MRHKATNPILYIPHLSASKFRPNRRLEFHLLCPVNETRTMSQTRCVTPQTSLVDFHNRTDDITAELVAATENSVFFTLANIGISNEYVEATFVLP